MHWNWDQNKEDHLEDHKLTGGILWGLELYEIKNPRQYERMKDILWSSDTHPKI